MRRQTVVVVGAGCSGALLSSQLLRCTTARVVLVDPTDAPGRGVAYGAAAPWHLLNSPVSAMSAHPDEPAHFLDWCRRRGTTPVGPGDFLARRRYGDYLGDVLDAAATAAPGRLVLRRCRARDVRAGTVTLADGTVLRADHTVLALGSPALTDPPAGTAVRRHPRYVADPWAPGALDAVPPERPVLLVGTGLTAVDVALSLHAAGHRSPVHAVSRHGLVPQSHRRPGPPVGAPGPLPADPPGLSATVRAVRSRIAAGADWRTLVDGLRPELDARWARLGPAGQDRFLRHLARHWEVHRHRMAPAVADRVDRLRADGALVVRAAAVRRIADAGPGALDVTLDAAVERFGAVVNCTGPGRLPGSATGLVATLLGAGTVRPGPHGLGLDVDPAGTPYDRHGRPATALWTIGPLRRGRLWETTAVPEIRSQAAGLALRLSEGSSGSAGGPGSAGPVPVGAAGTGPALAVPA